MKKILTIIIFTFISYSVYAVDISYIPANSTIVASAKIDSLSQMAQVDTQTFLNNLFLKNLSERYSSLRKDKRVSKAMDNITTILDFSKQVRFTSSFNMFYAIMFDIKDIKQLDKIMLLIARGEESVIQVIEEGVFRYLELDNNYAIAWNDEIFSILIKKSSVSDDYFIEEQDEKLELTKRGFVKSNLEYAKKIFEKKDVLKSDTFLALEKENNDINLWINSASIGSWALNYLYAPIFGYSASYMEIFDKIVKEYEDSSYTVGINFEKGLATAIINSYMPKSSFDSSKLKKAIDKKVYEFSPQDTFGFLSLAMNTDTVSMALDYMLKGTEIEASINKQLTAEGLGDVGGISGLVSSLGGDMFLSIWYDEENIETENMTGIFAVSFKNINTAKKIIDYLTQEMEVDEENENLYYYEYSDIAIYFKDNILYAGTRKSISDVVENKVSTQDKTKETLMQNNMFTLYIDVNYISKILVENEYVDIESDEYKIIENFNSLEITSNPVSKAQSKTVIKLNLNNTDKNSMEMFYNILEILGAMDGIY